MICVTDCANGINQQTEHEVNLKLTKKVQRSFDGYQEENGSSGDLVSKIKKELETMKEKIKSRIVIFSVGGTGVKTISLLF